MNIFVRKESPLLWRMIVLVFVMVCGIYICSICMKQINSGNIASFLDVQVVDRPCPISNIDPLDRPYLHFPKPNTYARAECACNPVRYFAIFSTQRSGSGWFETLLNSHMNVSSHGEIFSVKVRRTNVSTIEETLDKLYNLDWVSSAAKNECTAAVGLKWMLNQGVLLHHEEIARYFRKRNVSVIFLFRRNLLRRMISILANSYDRENKLLNGTHRSHVHSPLEAGILARYKPTIDTKKLIPELTQVKDMTTRALEFYNSTRHKLFYYEDVVKNHSKLTEVQDFLKVPRMELTSRQVKIHKGSLSEHVANWEDVQNTLNGTEFESFLYSDYKL